MKRSLIIEAIIIAGLSVVGADVPAELQLSKEHRTASPGKTTYYINPAAGRDAHSGLREEQAWRTFAPLNRLTLAAEDRVEIMAPGVFDQTLMVTGAGSKEAPIEIHFAPGQYDFFPSKAIRRKYSISNTNDDPAGEKAIGILFDGAKHIKMSGPGARLVYRGKMIEVCIDSSEDIAISDLVFDYHRPTVSEFRPTAIENGYVDIEVHKDSKYELKNGRINWIGEGWHYMSGMAQELDLESNEIWRRGDPLKGLRLEEVKPFHLRGKGRNSMKLGRVYQVRQTRRDCAGTFTRRSKDILWKDVQFNFLHGMGLVNQFSENLTFDGVAIAPDKESGRTCSAWADGIQVSGCRGKLVVKNCTFSGTHDDAINIHGTHLRVHERISEKQIRVGFMHHQTYGFMAFNPGDEITFVHFNSLETYGPNKVTAAVLKTPKEMVLTMEKPVPAEFRKNDAVENVTWTPEVAISGCKVMRIPTRGFLITTRRKVVVKENEFHKTHMSAILLENDAKGWFESGPVRDMTIRKNRFFNCGEPVININPQNSVPNDSVHRNIRVEENQFVLRDKTSVRGKSTRGLTIKDNTIYSKYTLTDQRAIQTTDCTEVRMERNQYLPLSKRANTPEAGDDK